MTLNNLQITKKQRKVKEKYIELCPLLIITILERKKKLKNNLNMATPETVPIADEIMSDFEDVSSPNSPSLSLEQSTRGSTPPTSTSSPPSTQNNDSKSKESLETDDVQDTVDNKKLLDDVNESQESTDSKDDQDREETRKESTDAKDIKSGGTKKNQDSKDTKESKKIKNQNQFRAPIATGISTEIEVTGENQNQFKKVIHL